MCACVILFVSLLYNYFMTLRVSNTSNYVRFLAFSPFCRGLLDLLLGSWLQ